MMGAGFLDPGAWWVYREPISVAVPPRIAHHVTLTCVCLLLFACLPALQSLA